MFAVCNAGVSPAELEPDSQFGRRGRRRYKAFWDSLAGVTKCESKVFPFGDRSKSKEVLDALR